MTRRKFLTGEEIASGDCTAIVVTHSTFGESGCAAGGAFTSPDQAT